MNNLRQKLFNGIESIFYNEEYTKTHWRLKVDVCVDEVLTHILNELPEAEEYIGDYGASQDFVDGWNHYREIIKEKLMGLTDFYTNGEETFTLSSRIPFPTPGTKCPDTKLKIK